MDKYPPLSVLVQWREQGKTPEWIHDRCLEYAGYNRVLPIPRLPRIKYPKLCSCGNASHAKGLCRKCYDKSRKVKHE